VLPHDDGKRGTVLLAVAVIATGMTLKLRFDYVSKYRDPCRPFGRISRLRYGIKDESFGPGGHLALQSASDSLRNQSMTFSLSSFSLIEH
jgi:hypothetical protein